MTFRKIVLVLLTVLGCGAVGLAQVSPQTGATDLGNEFAVVDEKLLLFAVNTNYVLQAAKSSSGKIIAVRIVPKHFLEKSHPEWVEPEHAVRLSAKQYQEIVLRLQKVTPLGLLVRLGSMGLTLSLRTEFWDEWEGGMVLRKVFSVQDELNTSERLIASFEVLFFIEVTGVVNSKDEASHLVVIDGNELFVATAEFERAKVGSKVTVRATSPEMLPW